MEGREGEGEIKLRGGRERPGKENIDLDFFKTDYELSKIRSNTCTSTCRLYFMFTLEKKSKSNDVKFHVIFVNY